MVIAISLCKKTTVLAGYIVDIAMAAASRHGALALEALKLGGFLRGVVIPLIFPKVPQSSQTESLAFPSLL